MMLGQERPFTARQNIGIVLARVQLTGIRCDGDTVNWRAEIVKCSCWYSPRCHDLWAGIAAKHRYCNFQGADALTKLHKCESAIKKRHLHFLKLLFRQAAQRVGRTFKKKKKKGKIWIFFFFLSPEVSAEHTALKQSTWLFTFPSLLYRCCFSPCRLGSCSFLNETCSLAASAFARGQEGRATLPVPCLRPGCGQPNLPAAQVSRQCQQRSPLIWCKSLTLKFDN